MKILLATSKGIPAGGGIASYNQELVNRFGKNHDIYLLTDADETDVDGYERTYRTIGNSNLDYNYCKRLVDKINDADYDCIINSNSNFIPVIAPFIKSNIISISHFVNGQLAINAGYNSKYQNTVISLSDYGKQFLIKKFRIKDSTKVKTIYNFVNPGFQSYNHKITHRPLRIVYPGGTSISKSVDVIQQVVYRLLSSNLDFEFYWIGGTNLPSAKFSIFRLQKSTDLFDNDDRLKITGLIPREEAVDIISSANIFLLPSRGEGCPMTLLEAMHSGCIPIVSDAKHGSREIIEKINCRLIVKQGSAKEIFNLIQDIIHNPEEYEHIYDETKQFLAHSLSPYIWEKQMNEILSTASNNRKYSISINRKNFINQSLIFYLLNKKERIKTMLRSIYYRLKFDYYYIINKIERLRNQ